MICPDCGSDNNRCKDSRQLRDRRRRRYQCFTCGERFTTHECVETDEQREDKRTEACLRRVQKQLTVLMDELSELLETF